MTHTNKAIQDSIDAGYRYQGDKPRLNTEHGLWYEEEGSDPECGYIPDEIFFMDKSWWECLGRMRKWRNGFRVMNRKILGKYKSPPEYYWHKMIAHIAAGGNYESYFETIYDIPRHHLDPLCLRPAEDQPLVLFGTSITKDYMTIETTSLDLSKRLAALGMPQKSYFTWQSYPFAEGKYFVERSGFQENEIAALTSGELGKMLPAIIGMKYLTITKNKDGIWHVTYEDMEGFDLVVFSQQSLSECLGWMLEYLLLNGFIKVADLQI